MSKSQRDSILLEVSRIIWVKDSERKTFLEGAKNGLARYIPHLKPLLFQEDVV